MIPDIDIVYLWVDGNDPRWQRKRDATIGRPTDSEQNCKGRYVDNDELRYSLRSIEMHAPWIRRVHIVTDSQMPRWLNTQHPKIHIVDHTEILPPQSLPCFNPRIVQHHLHLIPGLAEHFLYADDDMLFGRDVRADDFFATTADGEKFIVRMTRRPFKHLQIRIMTHLLHKPLRNHALAIHNSAVLIRRQYGSYPGDKTHHNIDAYLKSSWRHTRETFDKEIRSTLTNHMRADNDIERNLYSYAAIAEGTARPLYVNQRTSLRLHIDNPRKYERCLRYRPTFFCVNDSQFADDSDRQRAGEFLKELFPDKSQFEK